MKDMNFNVSTQMQITKFVFIVLFTVVAISGY